MRLVAIIILALALLSCATPSFDYRCSTGAKIKGPDRARDTIDLACKRFADRAGVDVEDLSLSGVVIVVRNWRESTDCVDSLACARLHPPPETIDVYRSDNWRALLIHEVYHVLLWRTKPDIHPDDHHRWLFERRLCAPDGSLCGYGLEGMP